MSICTIWHLPSKPCNISYQDLLILRLLLTIYSNAQQKKRLSFELRNVKLLFLVFYLFEQTFKCDLATLVAKPYHQLQSPATFYSK